MLVTFDTQEVVNELKNHGFTDEQAETLTKIQKQVINESMGNTIASKDDIHRVIDHIKESKNELTIENEVLKSRLAIVEKTQWIIIAGVFALVIKSFLL
jgi:hypothetical protein